MVDSTRALKLFAVVLHLGDLGVLEGVGAVALRRRSSTHHDDGDEQHGQSRDQPG